MIFPKYTEDLIFTLAATSVLNVFILSYTENEKLKAFEKW